MTTVLVTGAGGAATPGIISRLRSIYGHRVLAADLDPRAAGLYCADKGFVIPPGKSPQFQSAIREICRTESVDVVVPLVDEELLPTLELEGDRLQVLLPNRQFVADCLDKFILMQRLHAIGAAAPATILLSQSGEVQFPAVIKPRTGRGSRGVATINGDEELEQYLTATTYDADELILQQYLEGPEFTVSVTCWRDGQVQAIVPKEIIVKKGITRMAVTRRNESIDRLGRDIQKGLRADGPFNIQLILDKATGQPVVFEINPRFSTTVSLTIASGIDEVGALIRQMTEPSAPRLVNEWREGLVLLRRTLDEFVDETDFSKRPIVNLIEAYA